jgi:hypothetical protein
VRSATGGPDVEGYRTQMMRASGHESLKDDVWSLFIVYGYAFPGRIGRTMRVSRRPLRHCWRRVFAQPVHVGHGVMRVSSAS